MTLPRPFLPAVLIFACLAPTGCLLAPGDCTTEARWGLRITVRDAQTGNPAGGGATVTATAAGYAETLQPFPDSLTFVGATERPGVYDIRVGRVGYQPWNRQGVEVGKERCHVESVALEARLQPVAASSGRRSDN